MVYHLEVLSMTKKYLIQNIKEYILFKKINKGTLIFIKKLGISQG